MPAHRPSANSANNASDSQSPMMRLLANHYIEVLCVLAFLFILQTGLVPFDLATRRFADSSTSLLGASVNHRTLGDIISNIFLYVPLGALLLLSLSRLTKLRILLWPMSLILAGTLSVLIEWIQSFSSIRVSSRIDLLSNVVGAGLGGILACVARWLLPRLIRTTAMEWVLRPQAIALKIFAASLIIVAAAPFSLSFDLGQLKQSIKRSVFVPFGSPVGDVLSGDTLADESSIAAAQHRWSKMKRWSRWTAEAVSFAVLAWLLFALLHGEYQFTRRSAFALVFWIGIPFSVGLSLLQLPIVTRMFDVTDILFRCSGLGMGLLTYLFASRTTSHPGELAPLGRPKQLASLGAAGAAAYILYTGVIPLTFDWGAAAPSRAVFSEGFLPFFAYFMARFDLMMGDILEKILSYALLAGFLAASAFGKRRSSDRSRLIEIAVVGACLSVTIEAMQMFIPVRTTSLTDPILAAFACVVGVLAQQNLRFILPASVRPEAVKTDPPDSEKPVSTWSPVDEIMSTLADPHPDAPQEGRPTVPRQASQHQST